MTHRQKKEQPLRARFALRRMAEDAYQSGPRVCYRRLHHWWATFDALVFGYHEEGRLLYASRTRNGFTPKLRADLMKHFRLLETSVCPFANLPEKRAGRWGAGLTAAKMVECRWLKPVLVGQFEFVEWRADAVCASYCTLRRLTCAVGQYRSRGQSGLADYKADHRHMFKADSQYAQKAVVRKASVNSLLPVWTASLSA